MNIAITGGIGSGKSSVSVYLVKISGAQHCDTDEYCRVLMGKEREGWRGVVDKWGQRYIDRDGNIDRIRLRHDIFNDSVVRSDLEAILHPLVKIYVDELILSCQDSDKLLVVEVPLLFEIGWQETFDTVVTVYAPNEQCLDRIVKRDRVTRAGAEKAIKAQMPLDEKAKRSHCVIDNSGSWQLTCNRIEEFYDTIK